MLELVKAELLRHLNAAGKLDWKLWCVDGTSIRASLSRGGVREGQRA